MLLGNPNTGFLKACLCSFRCTGLLFAGYALRSRIYDYNTGIAFLSLFEHRLRKLFKGAVG